MLKLATIDLLVERSTPSDAMMFVSLFLMSLAYETNPPKPLPCLIFAIIDYNCSSILMIISLMDCASRLFSSATAKPP